MLIVSYAPSLPQQQWSSSLYRDLYRNLWAVCSRNAIIRDCMSISPMPLIRTQGTQVQDSSLDQVLPRPEDVHQQPLNLIHETLNLIHERGLPACATKQKRPGYWRPALCPYMTAEVATMSI